MMVTGSLARGACTTGGTARRGMLVPSLVITLTALTAACGDGEDGAQGDDVVTGSVDFEPSTEFLARASQRSAGEPFRTEASMSLVVGADGEHLDIDVPALSGERDGDTFEYELHLQPFLDEMSEQAGAPPLPVDDATIYTAGDADTLYIRAPFFESLPVRPGQNLGPYGPLAELDGAWGRVDLTALDDFSVEQLSSMLGTPTGAGGDPRFMLDLVATADDVERVGTDEVDGVPVNGVRASVTGRDILDAKGLDADDYIEQIAGGTRRPAGLDAEDMADLAERFMDAEVPVTVWVDGDGYVRRVAVEMDLVDALGSLYALAMDGIEEFRLGSVADFSDYGADDIAIDLPTDAVDATGMVRRALAGG